MNTDIDVCLNDNLVLLVFFYISTISIHIGLSNKSLKYCNIFI